MSDPFDARVLRSLVREAASDQPSEPDWDAVEERLFARLDDAPTSLSRSVDRGVVDDEGLEDDTTSVRLSELPSEDRASPDPDERASAPLVAGVGTRGGAVVHTPGMPGETLDAPMAERKVSARGRAEAAGPPMTSFAEADDAEERKSSAAIDAFHSPSLMLEGRPAARVPVTARRALGVMGALAVAACIALLVGSVVRRAAVDSRAAEAGATIQGERWVDPSELPMAAGLENVRDAAALQKGDVVEATQGAVAFGLKDRWMWTLAPGSRVRIEAASGDSGDQVVVLQNGSIRASVAGDARQTPFVVEADDARVSVEGTSLPALFTVTRSSKGLAVEVEQGATLVGGKSGAPHRLGAMERATLSLDGREFRLLDPIAVVGPTRTSVTADGIAPTSEAHRQDPPAPVAPRVEPRAPTPPASSAPSAAPTPEPPAAEPPVAVLTESGVRSSVVGCIEGQLNKQASQSGVSVSAESTVRFVVDEEGLIRSASFSPPLKPELQSCAAGLLRSKVGGGVRSIQFPISVVAR